MSPGEKNFLKALVASLVVLVGALLIDVRFLPIRVLTEFNGRPAVSPLYAFWIPAISARVWWPLLIAAAYLVWVRFAVDRCMRQAAAPNWLPPAQALWLMIFAVSVAMIRLPFDDLGAAMSVYPGEDFWDDVPKMNDPCWYLANFTRLQSHDGLSLHGMAHPPGHTLFLWVVSQLFGRSTQAAALSMLAVGSTSVLPIYLLTRRVFGDHVAGRTLVLFPVVPSIAMYAISTTDFLFLAFAAFSFWAAIEAVLSDAPLVAVVAGMAAALAALFSFAEGFVGIIVGLFAFATWIDRGDTKVLRQLAWTTAALLTCYAIVRAGLGYDWFESFRQTNRFHRSVIAAEIGRLTTGMWFYTSLGNLLAFAWYLGLPVVAGSALSLCRVFRSGLWSGSREQQLTRAVTLTLALMVFGALFLLEVERIWLYMVAPLLAAACSMLPTFDSAARERTWMCLLAGIMSLQCIVYESLLFTIW